MKMDQCDFCGVEKPDTEWRFTEFYPVWPSDGSPSYLSWDEERVCGCCFRSFLDGRPTDEQRQLTLEKNGEGSQ